MMVQHITLITRLCFRPGKFLATAVNCDILQDVNIWIFFLYYQLVCWFLYKLKVFVHTAIEQYF